MALHAQFHPISLAWLGFGGFIAFLIGFPLVPLQVEELVVEVKKRKTLMAEVQNPLEFLVKSSPKQNHDTRADIADMSDMHSLQSRLFRKTRAATWSELNPSGRFWDDWNGLGGALFNLIKMFILSSLSRSDLLEIFLLGFLFQDQETLNATHSDCQEKKPGECSTFVEAAGEQQSGRELLQVSTGRGFCRAQLEASVESTPGCFHGAFGELPTMVDLFCFWGDLKNRKLAIF